MDEGYQIWELGRRLAEARRITVMTGAGVSAASGVPTFRGPEGLWKTFRPEELATPQAFARNPRLVWEWYDWRRQVIAGCRPNAAHQVLARWSRTRPGFTLITQNVDGLHDRAGTQNVIHLHGSIWEVRCRERCAASPPEWRDETVPLPHLPPRCRYCGGLIRPAVVWFGEGIEPDVMNRCAAAVDCDVFLTAGTSAIVYPAAGLVLDAKRGGAFTAEINLDPTPASKVVDLSIRGRAEEILDTLDNPAP
jgi:NAD-dependent deacetylase